MWAKFTRWPRRADRARSASGGIEGRQATRRARPKPRLPRPPDDDRRRRMREQLAPGSRSKARPAPREIGAECERANRRAATMGREPLATLPGSCRVRGGARRCDVRLRRVPRPVGLPDGVPRPCVLCCSSRWPSARSLSHRAPVSVHGDARRVGPGWQWRSSWVRLRAAWRRSRGPASDAKVRRSNASRPTPPTRPHSRQ